jgi:hypothetical protein
MNRNWTFSILRITRKMAGCVNMIMKNLEAPELPFVETSTE